MVKFVIKASEFKNVCKAVNDRKLAELKKEIIEILKKQEEREVKKAVEFFEAQEAHYTHLEKSTLSGKWVEKAGYGIGTVRVWKGRKYKKIAPGKWARVYEKEGRGANVAVGRLIAQVNKIDNVEDLMNFAMMHKQRFVDENGMDLPILDKLRAAIDAKNGTVESKGTSKPADKVSKIDQAVSDLQTLDWSESDGSDVKDIVNRYFKTDKEKAKFADYVKNESKFNQFQKDMLAEAVSGEKKDTFEDEMNRLNDAQEAAWEGFESGSEIKATPENSKKFYDKVKKFVDENNIKLTKKHHDEIAENNGHSFNEALALAGAYGEEEKKKALEWNKETNKKYKGAALDLSQIDEFKETETEEKESETEKYQNRSDAMKGNKNAYKGKAEEVANKKLLSKDDMLKKPIKTIQKYANADVYGMEKFKSVEEALEDTFDTYKGSIEIGEFTKEELAERVGKEWAKKQNHDIAREIFKDQEDGKLVLNDEGIFEPKKETPKAKQPSGAIKPAIPGGEKEVVGTFTITEDGKAEMPATKEVAELFDSLKKAVSEDESRPFVNECYYDGENFVSTDGRRLVVIKAGDIGLPEGYVKINTSGGKITVEKNDSEELKGREFPIYKRVMPGSANTQEVKFDNKALKEKLKEMKKEGAFNKNSSTGVDIEFKDGKAYLDGTVVGSGDVKFPEGQEPFIKLNGFYLMDAALAGDSSSMFLDKDKPANKAADISTNNSDIVIMTMEPVRSDYESGRKAKKAKSDEQAAAKENNRKLNQERVSEKMKSKMNIDAVDKLANRFDKVLSEMDDERLKREYERFKFNLDKAIDKKFYPYDSAKVDNKLGLDFHGAVMYKLANERHPEIKDKIYAEIERRGLDVKKSIFSDFLIESFIDEEEEDEEEESLWNDYSAEQPELFNSTELMVREALNRRRCL